MDKWFFRFIKDFLNINPQPDMKQCRQLLFSIGIDKKDEEFVKLINYVVHSISKDPKKIKAMCEQQLNAETKVERILQDQYDPRMTSSDYMLINDDSSMELDNPGNIEELSQDGDFDQESIDQEHDAMGNDGTYRL